MRIPASRSPGLVAPLPLILVLIFAVAPSVSASTRTWPGAAPCDATLAVCLAASATGDTVELATDGVIDENIDIPRPINIVAQPGFHPRLAAGRSILVQAGEPSPWSLRLADLTLIDGTVQIYTTSDGTVTLERLEVLDFNGSFGLQVFPFPPSAAPTYRLGVAIRDCTVHVEDKSAFGIYVASRENVALDASVLDNRVLARGVAPPPLGGLSGRTGILAQMLGNLPATLDIARNQILPDPQLADPGARLSAGISVGVGAAAGTVDARVIDNVVVLRQDTAGFATAARLAFSGGTTAFRLDHNTLVGGGEGIRVVEFSATAVVSGTINGNLSAFHTGYGMFVSSTLQATVSNAHNAVYANGVEGFTPGPGTITTDPRIESIEHPRLRADSPLVDAGDVNARLNPGPGAFGMPPLLDADGLRRFKGNAVNNLDVGAFERGDVTLAVDIPVANSFLPLNDPALDGIPDHRLQITRSEGGNLDGVTLNPRPMTQFYSTALSQWRLLADDGGTIPAGAGFTVFVPGAGYSSGVHRTVTGNYSGDTTTLGSPFAGMPANMIFLVSGFRASAAVTQPDPVPFAAAHFNNAWHIVNLDGSLMSAEMRFAVYAQEPSPNAYRHSVRFPAPRSELDHRLLNGQPCARPHVSPSASNGVRSPHPVAVRYDDARGLWYLANDDAAWFPAGAQFFVVIDPQAHEIACGPRVFGDGFEAP